MRVLKCSDDVLVAAAAAPALLLLFLAGSFPTASGAPQTLHYLDGLYYAVLPAVCEAMIVR
jgi:hypothetical protein